MLARPTHSPRTENPGDNMQTPWRIPSKRGGWVLDARGDGSGDATISAPVSIEGAPPCGRVLGRM